MSITQVIKRKIGLDDGMPDDLSTKYGTLGMSRVVYGDDEYKLKIRKTFQTEVRDDGKFLIPAEVREDTTGRKHLTNDIEKQTHYNIGLLLAEPPNTYRATFRRYFTVRFVGYVTRDGYITIPNELRDIYHIESGQTVQVAVAGRVFEPEKEQGSYSQSIWSEPDWSQLEESGIAF